VPGARGYSLAIDRPGFFVCTFCERRCTPDRVVAGPGGHAICNDCVGLCVEIFNEQGMRTGRPSRDRLGRIRSAARHRSRV